MSALAPELEWITARDGSRTARDRATGSLLADCSVPRRAAEMMLRKLAVKGRVACLLLPTHAHQIAVCLERTDPSVGLIVIVDSELALQTIRVCHDFSPHDRRLFFAWDAASLGAVFDAHPGLPVPQQFVRLPVSDKSACDAAITWTQQVFSDVTARQNQRAEAARSRPAPASTRPLVVVSRTFRLWDDAGDRLARSIDADVIDTDDVTQCAAGHITARASQAGAILTANIGRADQVSLASSQTPWISWVTGTRVPAYVPTSPRDGVIVIDDDRIPAALEAGWQRERVRVGRDASLVHRGGDSLLIATDLPSLTPPAEVIEYSSWRVVWDAIARDLVDHPHRLAGDVEGYLERSRRHFGVPADDFPTSVFIARLVGPAYAIGIARWMTREALPLSIHGRGWEIAEGVAQQVRGLVESRERWDDILAGSAGIVDLFVTPAHPSRDIGLPRVTTLGRTPQRILQDARTILQARPGPTCTPATLATAVESLLA